MKFSTCYDCKKYIKDHHLNAVAHARYSEDDGKLLYWYIYYVD